ncbi:hypothetical protein, partial [Lujinxingia vulgaris]|uniref:hypothetical protein n=1 Tax=Lujinxingia vulgaris TaxID=2600176 RepID=UPI001E28BA29
ACVGDQPALSDDQALKLRTSGDPRSRDHVLSISHFREQNDLALVHLASQCMTFFTSTATEPNNNRWVARDTQQL